MEEKVAAISYWRTRDGTNTVKRSAPFTNREEQIKHEV